MPLKKSTSGSTSRQDFLNDESLWRNSRHIMIPRHILETLELDECLVFCHLAQIGSGDRWFKCTVEDLNNELLGRMSRNRQTRILKSLTEKEFIETKLIGAPPHRHVRITYQGAWW